MTALRTALSVAGALLLTAPAIAQAPAETATLARALAAAPCETVAAEAMIRRLLASTEASDAVQNAALEQVSADPDVCLAAREAAMVIALVRSDATAGLDSERSNVSASAAIVAEAYAEADRRAARLSFEVGPPPRNITKGRVSRF